MIKDLQNYIYKFTRTMVNINSRKKFSLVIITA